MEYKNEILLDLFKGYHIERPPIWIMRQAGRILPGYRAVRASVPGFKYLVKSPDLIAEVTTEPLEVLGVDAAILFSDILVIPEAMGLDYDIVAKTGPVFPKRIEGPECVRNLDAGKLAVEKLHYVFESIEKTKSRMNGSNPLIGFSGAPWTLFAYMLEGSGSKTFSRARRYLYEEPESSHLLLQKITDTIIIYLQEKVKTGVDVIQLFDSWANMLTVDQYSEFCIPYIKEIFEALNEVPTIFFPKGAWSAIPHFQNLNFDALSIDWKTSGKFARSFLGENKIIQGNLDPCQLYARPDEIHQATHAMIQKMGGRHIVNLGHGVYPDTPTDHVKHFVNAVKAFRYEL